MCVVNVVRYLYKATFSHVNHMNADKFKILIQKYQNGELVGKQKELLDRWFAKLGETDTLDWTPAQLESLGNKILHHIREEATAVKPLRPSIRIWLPYVAALLIFAVLGTIYYHKTMPSEPLKPTIALEQDVAPGGNRATLTLADGRVVNLSESQSGIIIGDRITYLDGNSVLDNKKENLTADAPSLLSLSTPKGGTYQITLPDGTKVWLNSASTLRYPSQFGNSERIVELEGEAYFEVLSFSSKSPCPFLVKTENQTVQVLGTHFNISAYADEEETKTTLVEGAVQIVNRKTNLVNKLRPGQQSIVRDKQTSIHTVNPATAVAWKSGIFYFENTPFEQMMKQIDRWYDIEVTYQGKIPDELFTGKMSRKVNLQVLVDFLKDSGVHSHIEGRQLIVIN